MLNQQREFRHWFSGFICREHPEDGGIRFLRNFG